MKPCYLCGICSSPPWTLPAIISSLSRLNFTLFPLLSLHILPLSSGGAGDSVLPLFPPGPTHSPDELIYFMASTDQRLLTPKLVFPTLILGCTSSCFPDFSTHMPCTYHHSRSPHWAKYPYFQTIRSPLLGPRPRNRTSVCILAGTGRDISSSPPSPPTSMDEVTHYVGALP